MPTPVRVRGKNTRDQSKKRNEGDVRASNAQKQENRRRKCPSPAMMLPSPSSGKALAILTNANGKQHKQKDRPLAVQACMLAPIEQLPVELLETIFLLSYNLAFPFASPRLCAKLSSRHVKVQLALHAFSPKQLWSNEGDSLPTKILGLQWMTLDLMRDCVSLNILRESLPSSGLVNSQGEKKTVHTVKRVEDGPASCISWKWGIDDQVCDLNINLRTCQILLLQDYNRLAWASRKGDGTLVRLNTLPPDVWYGSDLVRWLYMTPQEKSMQHYVKRGWAIPTNSHCNSHYLPRKLLHGPWTPEKCEFLEMLLSMGFIVDQLNTIDGEIASEGLHDAILEVNLRAVRAMVQIGDKFYRQAEIELIYGWRSSPAEKVLPQECRLDIQTVIDDNSCSHVGVVPNTHHLRSAVLEKDCPLDIVHWLAMASPSEVDWDDEEVMKWAIDKRSNGDYKGAWLLDLCSKGAQESLWTYHISDTGMR